MDNISQRLKAYIDAHPFAPAIATMIPSWINSTKLIRNPMKMTRRKSATVSRS